MIITRNCSRCGKTLDDAASREAGIGPVCRKLDNALLARTIPSDQARALSVAQLMVSEADAVTASAETAETFSRVLSDLTEGTGPDWRTTIKRIEWLLSWDLGDSGEGRDRLYQVVEALGYLAIVAAWRGETASGKALAWLQDDRSWDYGRGPQHEKGSFLFAQGVRNPAFNAAIKKCVAARFHKEGPNGKPCWSVPASQHEGFWRAVAVYYPNHSVEGYDDLTLLVKAAALAATSGKALTTAPAPGCRVTPAGAWIVVRTPHRNDDFIHWVKSLPWADRKWSSSLVAWLVRAEHQSALIAVARTCFGGVEDSAMRRAS